jgi:SAM-dependent methyltransferase
LSNSSIPAQKIGSAQQKTDGAQQKVAGAQQKSAEINFFDDLTRDRDYEVFTHRGYERVLRAFDAYLQPLIASRPGPLKAVDLGCGTGAFTSRLQRYGFDLHGVDISTQSVARASHKFPQVSFHVGDIEATPFPAGDFDVVFLSSVLHHFPDLTRTVAECGRILKPGGILLACDPHRGNPAMWMYRCKNSPFYSSKGVTENEEPLAKAALFRAFQVEPFVEVQVSAISGITYKHIASRVALMFLPAYNLLDRCFDLPPLRDRFGSFLITYASKGAKGETERVTCLG